MAAKIPNDMDAGSGTTAKFSAQPFKVGADSAPAPISVRYSVQIPFA